MPLLDLKIRVDTDNTIDFQFYSKPCSSKFVMLKSSAMPARVKMASLTQEVVRRLRNTRATLPWPEHHAKILTTFNRKMARSGYGEGYREQVTKAGVVGYEKQLEASRAGVKPLYRPRAWKKEERRRRKILRKASWYRPADCVGFFPPTPGGELSRKIGEVLEEEARGSR